MTTATFAAGCFWHVEHAFRQVEGVIDVEVGYTGGHTDDPTYREVCGKDTGHAEAVRVEYDPERVGYDDLLEVFWSIHDPTQLNRQGPDIGSQYRSAIFWHDETQREAAERSRTRLDGSGRLKSAVVTEITPAGRFWRAEEDHQQYFARNGILCSV